MEVNHERGLNNVRNKINDIFLLLEKHWRDTLEDVDEDENEVEEASKEGEVEVLTNLVVYLQRMEWQNKTIA